MKNMMKKIMVFLIAVVGIIPVMNVFAQSDMKVNEKIHFTAGNRRNTVFKTNKGYAYCVTPKREGPNKGTVLKYKGKITNGYVIYLLENANTSTYNNYYATQIAVWHYYNSKEVTTMSKSHEIWKKSRTLISNASSKKNYTGIQPTISISGNSGLTLTSDYNYYRSGALTVTMANATTNATLKLENAPSGARIVNSSNTTISSVANKGTFYVLIPRTSITNNVTFKVTASTKGKASVVNYYSTGTGKNQDLAVLEKEDKVAVTSKTLSVTQVKISCKTANGKYYGKDGKETTKEGYYTQCFPACDKQGNTFYGPNHMPTTEENYYNQCFPSCGTLDGKYYGNDGKEITKIEFEKQCKTHKCDIVGDSYFGNDGKEVSKSEYIKQCFPSCGVKNGKYYGPDRTEVSESEYRKQCFPSCGVKDGKYYDREGNEVSESEYRKQCLPSCDTKDGKYYDNNGNEITKEQYEVQCLPHSCDIVGNYFFGIEGKIVTEAEYQAQCIHKCEIYNNQYYGVNGDEVTAETFKEQCEAQVVPVPDTAVGSDFISIIMGSGMLGAVGGVLSHYSKRKHA